jgi:membrane-bound lytic murein transglycosylase B
MTTDTTRSIPSARPAAGASRAPRRLAGALTAAALVLAAPLLPPSLAPATPALAAEPKAAPRPPARRAAAPPAVDWSMRDDVRGFVRDMVDRHGFAEDDLLRVFGRTHGADSVVKLMSPPPPSVRRSWIAYRDRFVEPVRIREGVRFWRENGVAVRRAAERYGVPEEIIVAIIGVETRYGRHTGEFRVMDALTTLAFDYPRRAQYFREELEQFLLLSRELALDPLSWRGSFAGAVGYPQFMPGSIRRHAVDFDGDGRIDLRGSPVDAVGSVARFLADHGWRAGAPTHYRATVADETRARPAVDAGIPPKLGVPELADLGVTSPDEIPADERLALIDLPNADDATHYVLGGNNFWVITRYNRSYFYAMAVIDLARALREGVSANGSPS